MLNDLTNGQIIAWLGRQFWNQTFDDDVEVDVEEIRLILDDGGRRSDYR